MLTQVGLLLLYTDKYADELTHCSCRQPCMLGHITSFGTMVSQRETGYTEPNVTAMAAGGFLAG